MSKTHRNLAPESAWSEKYTAAERAEEGKNELLGMLADFKRRIAEVASLDELIESEHESID